MTATNQNGLIYANRAAFLDFECLNPDGTEMDFTGATARWAVAVRSGGTALLAKTNGAGITFDGNHAIVAISVGDLVNAGNFYQQLDVTLNGESLQTVATGLLKIESTI